MPQPNYQVNMHFGQELQLGSGILWRMEPFQHVFCIMGHMDFFQPCIPWRNPRDYFLWHVAETAQTCKPGNILLCPFHYYTVYWIYDGPQGIPQLKPDFHNWWHYPFGRWLVY